MISLSDAELAAVMEAVRPILSADIQPGDLIIKLNERSIWTDGAPIQEGT